jgi:hypothetical protein
MSVSARLGARISPRRCLVLPSRSKLALTSTVIRGPSPRAASVLSGRLSMSEPSTSSRRPRTWAGASTGMRMLSPTLSAGGPNRLTTNWPERRSRWRRRSRAAAPRWPPSRRRGPASPRRVRRGSARAWAPCRPQRATPHPLLVAVASISSASMPLASMAPTNAPCSHRRRRRSRRPAAVSSSSTPMCANARAQPPERAIPSERPLSRRASRATSTSSSGSTDNACVSTGSSDSAHPARAPEPGATS